MEQLRRSSQLTVSSEVLALPDVMWRRLVVGYKRFQHIIGPNIKSEKSKGPHYTAV